MASIKQSRIVNYSCAQMYALVNDIEHYVEFVPYCSQSVVHHRDADEVEASLEVSVSGVCKSFTTRNRLQLNKMIEIRLISDTFSHLEGFWRFDEVPDGCAISFDLEVEFSSKMVAFVFNTVLEKVTTQIVDAFCARASELYDNRHCVV